MSVVERRKLEHHGFHRSGQAGQACGDHECEELVAIHVVAKGHRPGLVLLDRLEHLPEGRADNALHRQIASQEDRQHEIVHGVVVTQVNKAEQVAAGYAVHTVLTTGKRGLYEEEVDQLRQRQGDHREIDSLAANGHNPEAEPQHRCRRCAHQNPHFGRQTGEIREQVTGGV